MHFIRFADFPLTNGLVLISLLKIICSATHPSLCTKCQRKQLCFVHQSRQRRVGSHSAFPGEKCLWPTATPLAHAMQWGPRSRPRGQITGSGYWVYLRDLCMTVASPSETQNNTGIARGSQTIYKAHRLGRILRVESQECCFGTHQFGSEANLMQVLACVKISFGRYYGEKCCLCRK